jgi:hypothetical protein
VGKNQAIIGIGLTITQIHRQPWGSTAHTCQHAMGCHIAAQVRQIAIVPNGEQTAIDKGIGLLVGVIPSNAKTIGIDQPRRHLFGLIALLD